MTSNRGFSRVYISLGSNIEPKKNLTQAVRLLNIKSVGLTTSSVYLTPPQGFTDQEDFYNMALSLQTLLEPFTFKRSVLDWIETELRRKRDPNNKNAPRTIDLDISLWDDAIIEYGDKPYIVPDPDILRFAHVAIPLAEIAPDYVHPVEKITLAEIARRFDSASFQRLHFPFNT